MSLGRIHNTILNHLNNIKHSHRLLSHDLTWDSDHRYKLLRGVKQSLGTAVKRKAPITPRLLLLIAHFFDIDNRFRGGSESEYLEAPDLKYVGPGLKSRSDLQLMLFLAVPSSTSRLRL